MRTGNFRRRNPYGESNGMLYGTRMTTPRILGAKRHGNDDIIEFQHDHDYARQDCTPGSAGPGSSNGALQDLATEPAGKDLTARSTRVTDAREHGELTNAERSTGPA